MIRERLAVLTQALHPSPPYSASLCEQCQVDLPRFVTDELAGRSVDVWYPETAVHLDNCPRCLHEYELLSQLMVTGLQ